MMTAELGKAVRKGDLTAVRRLIAAGTKVAVRDPWETPITDAAYKANPAFVIALAEAGAKVNYRFSDRSTPLMVPAVNGYVDTLRALLRFGSDPNRKNDEGHTSLVVAVIMKHTGIARLLLDARSDSNARDKERVTLLMWAAEVGSMPVVELLLRRGADPTLRCKEGRTAADHARANRKAAVARYLDGLAG